MIIPRADGARPRHGAEALGGSDPTVRLGRTRWAHATPPLAAADAEADAETRRDLSQQVVRDGPRRGRPATFTPEQRCPLVAVACEAPEGGGRPVSPWTSRDLADELLQRGMVLTMAPRRVGRFVTRRGREPPSSAVLAHA
jgi:putative transposase